MFKAQGCIGSDVKKAAGRSGAPYWTWDMAVNFGPRDNQVTVWVTVIVGGPQANELEMDKIKKRDVVQVEGKLELKGYGSLKAMQGVPVPDNWTDVFNVAKNKGGLKVDTKLICSSCSKVERTVSPAADSARN